VVKIAGGSVLKRLLLASSSLLALSTADSGFAADMPLKAPPIVAVPYSWSGCYVGAQVGDGWGRKEIADVPPNAILVGDGITPGRTSFDTSGLLAGGQLGCNYQFSPHWLIGIEGDLSASNIVGRVNGLLGAATEFDAQTKWLGSTTGRFGYAFDRTLLYVKGGPAWAGDRYGATDYLGYYYRGSETRDGWTLGAGLEWAFVDNWTARIEYDYYGFGTRTVYYVSSSPLAFVASEPESISQRVQTVTLGINYRFNTGPAAR
jgi:opacity protein-like surface antigen